MIVLQTCESSLFESAYFVLRRGSLATAREGEMIAEASRLIGEGSAYLARRARRPRGRDVALGALAGVLGAGLVFALFCIFM